MKEGEPLKVLSLFSGVGGMDMGLTNTGKMTTAFMCEIDKHARSVLDYHWPEVPKWDDVTTLTGAYILEKTGGVDVVAWGSPCQDLSIAGKRAGLTGERSGLFHHGIRIIKELRELSNGKYPTWSIWENVAGALSSNKGADFGEVLYEMDEAGACFSEWSLLDAQYFGVPQRRRRVFVTSCFDSSVSERCPEPLLPVAQSLPGDSASRSKTRQGVTGASSDSVGAGSQLATGKDIANTISASLYHKSTVVNQDVNNGHLVVEQPLAFDTQFGSNANVFENQSPTLKSSQQPPSVTQYVDSNQPIIIDRAAFNQGVNAAYEAVISEDDIIPSLVARGPHAVGQPLLLDGRRVDDVRVYTEPVQTLQERMGTGGNNVPVVAQETYVKSRRAQSVNDHETWVESDVAPTLNIFDVGDIRTTTTVVEPEMIVRRLTPLECERLMGWPDGHTAEGINGPVSDTQRYKMCGNGVASPVAQWIGEHIARASGRG